MSEMSMDTYKTFHKGEVIAREGQVNTVAWMIRRGAVSLYRVVENRRVVLARLEPGNIFGEMSLVTGEPATANAVAEEYTELIPFDRALLHTLLLKSPNPIQRILVLLMEQLQTMHGLVQPQPTADMFLGLCTILDLAVRAARPLAGNGADTPWTASHAEFSRLAKDIVLVSQLELDAVLETLVRFNMVEVHDPGLRARDKRIEIKDPGDFLAKARRMREAVREAPIPPHTEGLEFLDMRDLADKAGVTPEELRAKIAQGDMPESLLFFARNRAERWLAELEQAMSGQGGKPRRREGETIIDDVVRYPDAKVQRVLMDMAPEQLALLFAAADKAAKVKLLDNMSAAMGDKIEALAQGLEVDIDQLARVEVEFFRRMRLGER